MKRYNNSYRMIHYNEINLGDAITTIDKKTYDEVKDLKYPYIALHGNKVVKTINVYDNYPLYEVIRNTSLKRRLKTN